MTRLKTTAALLGAAALTLTLGACGGGGGDYCDLLTEAQDTLDTAADPTDPDAMSESMDRLQEVADAAPSEVSEDWDNLVEAMQAFTETDDPTSIDPEQFGDLEAATTNITEHAQEECDITLE